MVEISRFIERSRALSKGGVQEWTFGLSQMRYLLTGICMVCSDSLRVKILARLDAYEEGLLCHRLRREHFATWGPVFGLTRVPGLCEFEGNAMTDMLWLKLDDDARAEATLLSQVYTTLDLIQKGMGRETNAQT